MTLELLEKIAQNFSRDELAVFFRKKSQKFVQKMESLDGYDGDKFGKFAVIGEIELKDRFKLVVVVVEKNDSLTERSSRKAQFDLAKKIMQERFAFHAAAIFVFHDRKGAFRFSLIHRQYTGTKAKFNPFRRFTYFVSPQESNRTFLDRMDSASFESLDEIRDAFSVEKVNKEFYQEIEALFRRFVNDDSVLYPDVTDDRKETKEFAVRLLGRIIFCWFLKKKRSPSGLPLLPDALLASKIVDTYAEYYHDILEPLFFEVLNAPAKERNPRALLQIGQFADKIPFLNGGLFDPEPGDKYIAGVNGSPSQSSRNIIVIPNTWFIDLFGLLERFNFTLDENTPVDIELSIDPEMLGRIFENLLAEINPETGNTARNATGSFYTPRPIVEYMVNQSLKKHLVKVANITEETADCLLSYHSDVNCVPDEKERTRIIEALDRLKVLDPACGSGAFPMGMLQKMLLVLDRIDPGAERWLDRMLTRVPSQFKAMVCRNLKKEGPEYVHKMGLIQEVIYGVDNQTIAVELSRLRVFLSLIIEARVDDAAENRGIHPLPNLDFKFVCADTLVRLNNLQTGATDMAPQVQDLKDLRELYFTAYGKDKEQYKEEFTQKQAELFKFVTAWVKDSSDTKLLAEWSPFKSAPAPFFDPDWMFGVKDGFDIVIGNPPYIQLQSNHGELADRYAAQNYLSFARTGDLYCIFYERGNELLKEGGLLCYITSNKWMRAKYGEKMRGYFLYRFPVRQVIDFGDSQIFEAATTYTNILIAEKEKPRSDRRGGYQPFPVMAKVWDLSKVYSLKFSLEEMLTENDRYAPEFTAESFLIISSAMKKIKERIEQVGTPLKDWDVQINYGIKTGFNEAFIIDGATKDRLIKQDPKSAEIIKPLLRGRDIKKYSFEFADLWLINAHNGYGEVPRIDINDYPAIKKHLEDIEERRRKGEFGEKAQKAKGLFNRDDQGDTPYNLRNCAYVDDFEKEKIAWGNLAQEPSFATVPAGYLINAPSPFFATRSRYLLALMNSKTSWWFLKQISAGREGGFFEIKPMYIEQLPIPKPNKSEPAFEALVDCIQFCYKHSMTDEAELFTDVVDHMVFDRYFEKEMKEGGCYATDHLMTVFKPFFKKTADRTLCEKLYRLLKGDQTYQSMRDRLNQQPSVKIVKGTPA